MAAVSSAYYYPHDGARRVDVTEAYYSDDDGQTYFKDSVYKFPPFDHGGKTVVQAVLAESNGHRFVGYLMRYTPQAREKLQQKYDGAMKNGLPLQRTRAGFYELYLRRWNGSKTARQWPPVVA